MEVKWWDYLDGKLPELEREAFEQKLSQDADLRAAFEEARVLHQALREMEADAPSMRFSKDVLEQLPQQRYRGTSIAPMLSTGQLRSGIGLMLGLALLTLLIALIVPTVPSNSENGFAYIDRLLGILLALPVEIYWTSLIVSFALVSYAALDWLLRWRLLR